MNNGKQVGNMKKNNKKIIPGIVIILLALTGLIGGLTFLGPCVHDDGSFGACHYAGMALTGICALILAENICHLFVKRNGFRQGVYICTVMTAVLGILIPGTLIDLCKMATMRCRAVMRPGMTIIFILICVAALIGVILTRKD